MDHNPIFHGSRLKFFDWFSSYPAFVRKKIKFLLFIILEVMNNSDDSFDDEQILYRRRKRYFDCSLSQKKRNKNLIKIKAYLLNEFTKSLGLEVKEIVLTNYENEMEEEDGDFFDDQIQMQTFKTKHIIVTVHEDDPYQYTENYKTLKCLEIKDVCNISNENYRTMRKTLSTISPNKLTGLKRIYSLKIQLDNLFIVNNNEKGFYFEPEPKIKFVCKKFLSRNPNYTSNVFNIKLSCDGITISKTKVQLLNFSFNLLDDKKNVLNVEQTYILGNAF